MKIKGVLKRVGVMALVFSMLIPVVPSQAAKLKLNKTKITINFVEEDSTVKVLKVSGAKTKVKWSCPKKYADLFPKGKNKSSCEVAPKKEGKFTVTAKVGKKKLKCIVTSVMKKKNMKVSTTPTPLTTLVPIQTLESIQTPTPSPTPIVINDFTFEKKKIEVRLGETANIGINVSPAEYVPKKITYKSSNTSVVSCDKSGLITTKKIGLSTIEVNCDGIIHNINVYVSSNLVSDYTQSQKIEVGIDETVERIFYYYGSGEVSVLPTILVLESYVECEIEKDSLEDNKYILRVKGRLPFNTHDCSEYATGGGISIGNSKTNETITFSCTVNSISQNCTLNSNTPITLINSEYNSEQYGRITLKSYRFCTEYNYSNVDSNILEERIHIALKDVKFDIYLGEKKKSFIYTVHWRLMDSADNIVDSGIISRFTSKVGSDNTIHDTLFITTKLPYVEDDYYLEFYND